MKHVLLLVLLAVGCAQASAQNTTVEEQRSTDAKVRRANARSAAADRKAQEALDAVEELKKADQQRAAEAERREQAREKTNLDRVVDTAQIAHEESRIEYLQKVQMDAVNHTAPTGSSTSVASVRQTVASPTTPPEPIASISLSNGRVLKDVYLKSFATKSVLVKHSTGAETVPYELFPEEYSALLTAKRPRARSDAEIHADAIKANSMNATVPRQNSAAHMKKMRSDAQVNAAAAQSAEIATVALLNQHTAAAKSKAEKYFKYEYVNGAGPSRVEIETDEPVEISGWTGRYRVTGKAYLAFHEGRRSVAFEVETEAKGRIVKAISILAR